MKSGFFHVPAEFSFVTVAFSVCLQKDFQSIKQAYAILAITSNILLWQIECLPVCDEIV